MEAAVRESARKGAAPPSFSFLLSRNRPFFFSFSCRFFFSWPVFLVALALFSSLLVFEKPPSFSTQETAMPYTSSSLFAALPPPSSQSLFRSSFSHSSLALFPFSFLFPSASRYQPPRLPLYFGFRPILLFGRAQKLSSSSSSSASSFSFPSGVVTPETVSASAVSTPLSSPVSSLVGGATQSGLSSPSASSSSASFDSPSSSSSSFSTQRQDPQQPRSQGVDTVESSSSSSSLPSSSKLGTAGSIAPSPSSLSPSASFTNVNMLLLAVCLLCCFTLGYLIHVNVIPHLPDSAAAMLTGFVFGLLARVFGSSPSENSFLHFDPQFFYFVLLPPIVLEAGFCLNKTAFLNNLGAILLLSILGTQPLLLLLLGLTPPTSFSAFFSSKAFHTNALPHSPGELLYLSLSLCPLVSSRLLPFCLKSFFLGSLTSERNFFGMAAVDLSLSWLVFGEEAFHWVTGRCSSPHR